MKALTVRQPWAWAILHAGKRIENRSWSTAYRGPLLIHASSGMTGAECEDAMHFMVIRGVLDKGQADVFFTAAGRAKLERGGIIGRANLVDLIHRGGLGGRCYPSGQAARIRHRLAEDPWYVGDNGIVLADVEPTPFVPCKGALGLWHPSDDVLRQVGAL